MMRYYDSVNDSEDLSFIKYGFFLIRALTLVDRYRFGTLNEISLNFLVWKFCGNVQFPQSFWMIGSKL